MRRRRNIGSNDDAEVDMTPMLDIVFIMLIFFIVTATFLDEQGIDMSKPPDTDAPPTSKPKPAITVYVSEQNFCTVDGRGTECDRVVIAVESLLADKPDANIILRIHNKSMHGIQVLLKDAFDRDNRPVKLEHVGG